MSGRNYRLAKAALSALYFTGADRVLSPMIIGRGVIFTLHHVRPDKRQKFHPNRILEITPEFLDTVIRLVIRAGFDIITIDDLPDRIRSKGAPFACFTFDDGYRDNRDFAFPILKHYGVPFTVYVASDFADGRGFLWWLVLEEIVRRASDLRFMSDTGERIFKTRTVTEKNCAYHEIYWWLRGLPELQARAVIAEKARAIGYDPYSMCADLVMSWDELRVFASDPLVTVGAHTCTHLALAKLPDADARKEIAASIARVEAELGRQCSHFSYPYGCERSAGAREFEIAKSLGQKTAVTTRKGFIHSHHAGDMTALPRVSLNGDFQNARYIKTILTGAPFALSSTLS